VPRLASERPVVRRVLLWVVLAVLAVPAHVIQLGCPGYTLGQDSYDEIVGRFVADQTRFREAAEGWSCPAPFRLLIVFAPIQCEVLPLMAIGSGLIFSEDTHKLVSVGLLFPYQPGFHAALLKGLRRNFTEFGPEETPVRMSAGDGVLTAGFRGHELLISLEQPAGGTRNAPMSTVTYVLPDYLEMSRQDMRLCR
jgi:hypothetical protein